MRLTGDWLIGSNQDGGAHKKYEPSDLRFDECKKRLHEAYLNFTNASKSTTSRTAAIANNKKKSRLETFIDICHNFKAVFRHFLMENYPNTDEWYMRRLNYTRSVATSSIVGYIIGLGDRHVQNILVDVSTADVVHIDLGIAFDQGKILPIPETIPFR
jgi:ataxia telangiectasia mutated family protein